MYWDPIGSNNSSVENNSGGILENNSSVENNSGGILENNSSVENNSGGILENNSSVENNGAGTLENEQLVLIPGSLHPLHFSGTVLQTSPRLIIFNLQKKYQFEGHLNVQYIFI